MCQKLRTFVHTLNKLLRHKVPDVLTLDTAELNTIKSGLGTISNEELGISDEKLLQELSAPFRAPISYLKVCDSPPFYNIGIFALKQGCQMPLHNHRGMYGVIRVLLGSGTVDSYSLTNACDELPVGKIVDVVKIEKIKVSSNEGSNLIHLEPSFANIHRITADRDSPLVILDLLLPPYDHQTFTISYFNEADAGNGVNCKLEVVPEPPDYACDHLSYDSVRCEESRNE